ncbi:hypothetical protein [Saccharothrix sp. HUAS TT1]|uniref:hypothetical protein n=1 Tax=unclassified Saccharothrix TaxID=2593673 RepID=UPI00345BC3A5
MTEPVVTWSANNLFARRIRVSVANWMFGWTAYLGDYQIAENTGDRPIEHTYNRPGCYWLYVTRQGQSTAIGQHQVVIRAGRDPDVTFSRDPHNPAAIRVHWPALDDTRVVSDYVVDWTPHDPDDPPVTYTDCLPGTFVERVFPDTADRPITITDLATKRIRQFTPHLPAPAEDPAFSLSATGRVVTLTVHPADRAGRRRSDDSLLVDWGDGSLAQPLDGDIVTHTYPAGPQRTHLVQLWHADASASTTKAITVGGPQ